MPLVTQDTMDDEAKKLWKDIMAELMKDPMLKPFGKHVGPFAAFKRDEAAGIGVGALDASVPFDELALLKENSLYLVDKLKVNVDVAYAEELKDASHKDSASNAQPGTPAVHFSISSDGGKAVGSSNTKASGGKAANANTNAKASSDNANAKAAKQGGNSGAGKQQVGVITDMKKLNEHLSPRSYFEGG